VLESKEFGVTISAREYYNSVRKMITDKEQPQTINGLLMTLQEGFVYGTRVKVEEDNAGEPVKRQMVQLWFTHREQLNAAARCCSNWLLVIDGTFNTNKDRLPLLIAVGVLNSGKTFPACFSYCPSPSALCGTHSKKNASNLTEICPILPILVSSLEIKLAACFGSEGVP
jgi:hypothetical protein